MEYCNNITNWIKESFPKQDFSLSLIAGDASLRKYYRLSINNTNYILMDSSQDPSFNRFIYIANQLKKMQTNVPDIIKINKTSRLLLLTDFGDEIYLKKLNEKTCDKLYLDAISSLVKMQLNIDTKAIKLKNFNLEFTKKQLKIFSDWYLKHHLQLSFKAQDKKNLDILAEWFAIFFQNQPQSFIHLDYHSRNLILLQTNNPGIIDFQDGMIGPTMYDLVSLLQDAYICWEEKRIIKWLKHYQSLTKDSDLRYESFDDMLKAFHIIGLQRHLKNLGIFSRLYYRDKKTTYLNHIPQLLSYIKSTLRKYPEVATLVNGFFMNMESKEKTKIF